MGTEDDTDSTLTTFGTVLVARWNDLFVRDDGMRG